MLRCVIGTMIVCGLAEAARAQDATGESYRAHLAAAEYAMRQSEPGEARRWIDGAPRERRGWEWFHLAALLDQSRLVAKDLPAGVYCVSLHPDGTLVAVALSSGKILIVDTATGATKKELPGHAGGTFCVRYSPDGARLATAGADRIARVWNAGTGIVLTEFTEHKFPVTSVVFTADGSRIFSSAYYVDKDTPIEGRVHQWKADSGELLRTYRGGVKPLSALAIDPEGTRIAAGSWDSCVFVWKVDATEDEAPVQLGGKPGPLQNIHINAVSFSPDGSLLAAGSDHHWAKVYRIENGKELATLSDAYADFSAVAFAPDGATIALGGDNGSITLWNTSDWTRRATLRGHTQSVRALAWNSTGTTLYSSGTDRTVRAWDPAYRAYGGLRGRYGQNNYSVTFSSDGTRLACSSSDGTIGTINTATGAESMRFTTRHEKEVCTAAISPDGTQIASCSWDKTFRIHDLATHKEIARIDLPAGAAYFSWNTDGRKVALALRDSSAVIVDVAMRSIERTLTGHSKAVNTVAWNMAGTRVLTGSADASAKVWAADTGECLVTMRPRSEKEGGHEGAIESAVFVPNANLVATASHDGSIRVWDAVSGELVRVLLNSSDSIYRIAASPDGRRLAAGGKYLYILDPQAAQPLLRQQPLGDKIWHLDWSKDGARLAVGSWNGEVAVFTGESGESRQPGSNHNRARIRPSSAPAHR